jgi:hypothetical protein
MDIFILEAVMKYWCNAFLGLGVTLIAATIIKFDWLGGITGVMFLFAGYALHRLSDEKRSGI